MDPIDALIAKIQEAPFTHDLWPELLVEVANISGGWSGQLFAVKGGQFVIDVSGGYDRSLAAELVREGGADPIKSPRPQQMLRRRPLEIFCDADYVSVRERERWEIYRRFYERVDGYYNTAAQLFQRDDALVGIAINHSKTQGAPSTRQREILQVLLPHLRNAALTQLHLENQTALIALGAMEALSIPAILCDGVGEMIRASSLAAQEIEEGQLIQARQNKISAANPRCDKSLQSALKQVSEEPLRGKISVLLYSNDGSVMAPADVAPLPACSQVFRLGARSILALPSRHKRCSVQHLAELGLTNAESEVGVALFQGQTLEEIALHRQTSRETVKTQIKAIYAKLGVNSRAELHEKLRPLF